MLRIFQKKERLTGIKTEIGNRLLRELAEDGWRTVSEYSDKMFDKGIDFDAYTLKRGRLKLNLQWDNWEEWEIEGNENSISVAKAKLSEYQRHPRNPDRQNKRLDTNA